VKVLELCFYSFTMPSCMPRCATEYISTNSGPIRVGVRDLCSGNFRASRGIRTSTVIGRYTHGGVKTVAGCFTHGLTYGSNPDDSERR
jgi:hypothetical protein